jgi:hypothetical protein
MAERDMKSALSASLQAEEHALDTRMAKADAYFAHAGTAPSTTAEQPHTSPAKAHDKVIRDGFSMPASDYKLIAAIQARALTAGIGVTKSKILRAGLRVLDAMPVEQLKEVLAAVEDVKTGRPLVR